MKQNCKTFFLSDNYSKNVMDSMWSTVLIILFQNFRSQRQLETLLQLNAEKTCTILKSIFSAFVFVQGVCFKFHNF